MDPKEPAVPAEDRWNKFVLEAIEDLEPSPRSWVGIIDLREKLLARGTSRASQDEHLRRMSRERLIATAPESNRKVLTQADHDAALTIGGESNHLVRREML